VSKLFQGARSGVFLAIDANIELAEKQNMFDLFGYFQRMRKARKSLIETIEQYKFVYDTLEEYALSGNSHFPVKEISARIKQKSLKNPFTKLNDYQHEFAIICKQTPKFSIGDCAGGTKKTRFIINFYLFILKHSTFNNL
jgi:hypothetical protein